MARSSRSSDSDSGELTATARATWHVFTRYTVVTCVAVAATLLLMLLVFKIL